MRRSNQKGITLIALVITIIVLIILAGISIMMISGQDGILQRAGNAKDINDEAQKDERKKLDQMDKLITSKIGKIDDKTYSEQGYIARMDNIYYKTLQSAIDDVEKNNTKKDITMINDSIECITVYENQDIVLNLNGKILDSDNVEYQTILNNGTLSISGGILKCKDSNVVCNYGICEINSDTEVTTQNENNGTTIVNYEGANLIINGAKVYSKTGGALRNKIGGTVEINDATITTDVTSQALNNYGNCNIGGNTVINTSDLVAISNYEKANMAIGGNTNASSENSNVLVNFGVCNIKDNSQFKSSNERNCPTVVNRTDAEMNISSGKIYSENCYSIWNWENGTMQITGGDISSNKKIALYNQGIATIKQVPNFRSVDKCTVYNGPKGNIEFKGGKYISENSNVLNNYGKVITTLVADFSSDNNGNYPTIVNQSGGEIIAARITAYSKNSYAIWNKSGATLTLRGGKLTTDNSATIRNESNATLTIAGGVMMSTDSNGLLNYGNCEINGGGNILAYNEKNRPAIINYSGGILKIISGYMKSGKNYCIWNKEGGSVTVTGGNISSESSYAIYNSGNCTVENGATITGKTYGI